MSTPAPAPPTPEPADLMTTAEAAARLGMSINGIQNWVHKGYLEAVKLPPTNYWVRFRRADVEALAQAPLVRNLSARRPR